jgi:prepilin-type N-terminal cleavage/methylation domain-containing protein
MISENHMKKIVSLKKGFTLLEILLVVGIIAILAGIVILAINPSKQLGDTRNAERRSDVLAIANAIYQYAIDTNGVASTTVTNATNACTSPANLIAATSTGGGINLWSDLVGASSTYLSAIPRDPLETVATSSGYGISYSTTTKRITVCAPRSVGEGSIVATTSMISVTR